MANNAKVVVFTTGLTLGGVAIALITGSVSNGGLTARTIYLTGIGLLVLAGALLAVAPFYQRFVDMECAISSHKSHDRDALREAMRIEPPDDTGGQRIPRIGR